MPSRLLGTPLRRPAQNAILGITAHVRGELRTLVHRTETRLDNWRGCSHALVAAGRRALITTTQGTYHNKDALSRHEGTRPGFGDTLAPTFSGPGRRMARSSELTYWR